MKALIKPLVIDADPVALGLFELLGVLGQGGMGRVYLARRIPLHGLTSEVEADYFLTELDEAREDSLAVVKIIKPEFLAAESGAGEAEKRARFAREIRAVQAVVSDRVPTLLGAHPDAAQPWFAVDYVHGPSLYSMVKGRGPLAVGPAVALGLAMVDALRAIHDAGLLHRDLKPGNVVLGPDGPVVLDFGLAVLAERRTSQAMTKTGLGWGTIDYMPWEQTQDFKRVKHPADIYSLGATLFFAATGRPPYAHGPAMTSPSWAGVDPHFIPLLAKIIVANPLQRPTLDEVLSGLLEILAVVGLTEQAAEHQLRDAVAEADLAPELPPGAEPGRVNPEVQAKAQAAVDDGAAPDSPWGGDDDLLLLLLGGGHERGLPEEMTVPAPPPSYEPTVPDPLARPAAAATPEVEAPAGSAEGRDTVTSYRLPPPEPGHEPAALVPAATVAPPAALRAAEKLRVAYARSRQL